MKKVLGSLALIAMIGFVGLGSLAYGACDPVPEIINQLPRMGAGWSGAVAWYNGKIYEVSDAVSYANIKNPVTGVTEGNIYFGSWCANDIKGFTYDPFRGTFWAKVGSYAYEVAVTGGDWISRFDVNNRGGGLAYGIWKDPEDEFVMWVADPAQPQVRKVDMRTGSVLQYINTDFNVRGVSRVNNTLWCVRAGEPGQTGVLIQINMAGDELCKYQLPVTKYDHDAGGCDLDPDGYLWVEGGKGSNIYQMDIGYVPTTPTPATSPTPAPAVIDSGDYTGDGFSDIAIFRPSSGLWAIKGVTRAYYGQSGDIPASGDYDGDGVTDPALFRPGSGLWAVKGLTREYFGSPGDIPVPGDYTGDGTCDLAVFRPASGLWAVKGATRAYFGGSLDRPVPIYMNGRSAPKNIAIFRASTGLWAVRDISRIYFGATGDEPVLVTDDEGEADAGIFRPSTGLWALLSGTRVYFGAAGDQPVPGDYSTLPTDFGIFRKSSGLWAIRGLTRVYFGSAGDVPVTGLAINPSSASGL